MKLRIRDDSLRLRLTRLEVEALLNEGRVEAAIRFGPDRTLGYAIETSDVIESPAARYEEDGITVVVPAAWVGPWVESDQVGFEGEQDLRAGAVLKLLVEKDFKCLHRPIRQEEDLGTYPHPRAATQNV